MVERAQDVSALADRGASDASEGELTSARLGVTPMLRPALKYNGRIYKAPIGGQHLDAIISARKKLIHAMPLNADRPINRATVVGCASSATPNYLKLHVPTKSNPLFGNNRAKTLKLCIHSRPPLFEFPKSSTS
jgi:hypothetical protein